MVGLTRYSLLGTRYSVLSTFGVGRGRDSEVKHWEGQQQGCNSLHFGSDSSLGLGMGSVGFRINPTQVSSICCVGDLWIGCV